VAISKVYTKLAQVNGTQNTADRTLDWRAIV